ncbi:hypothetical protein [Micromonospora sp. B9E7]|uniref:hypothetical protein n=1 Tax=Micromonospora sp. B9E7 TaxID=3153574 RepID=UPI00325C5EB7
MSNHRHPNVDDVAAHQPRPPKRRRARWFVAGVAGLTGVAGLAVVGAPGAVSGSGLLTAGERVLAGSSRLIGDDDAARRSDGRDGKAGAGRRVNAG